MDFYDLSILQLVNMGLMALFALIIIFYSFITVLRLKNFILLFQKSGIKAELLVRVPLQAGYLIVASIVVILNLLLLNVIQLPLWYVVIGIPSVTLGFLLLWRVYVLYEVKNSSSDLSLTPKDNE